MNSSKSCQRCGTCCLQGGPALHAPDMELLHAGYLHLDDLITIRRGELAFQPMSVKPEPVTHEFLKLKGKGGTWCCLFYDEEAKGCLRYAHRPQTCRILDCRNEEPVLALVGQNLLTRFDCIDQDSPLLSMVQQHEEACPCPDLLSLGGAMENGGIQPDQLADLEKRVNQDLAYRGRVTAMTGLTLAQELFYFGRPLFQLLQPLGINAANTSEGVCLTQKARV
jgi:Fe-S-cluster containining protein